MLVGLGVSNTITCQTTIADRDDDVRKYKVIELWCRHGDADQGQKAKTNCFNENGNGRLIVRSTVIREDAWEYVPIELAVHSEPKNVEFKPDTEIKLGGHIISSIFGSSTDCTFRLTVKKIRLLI